MGAISIWHTYSLTWHTYRTNTWTSSHAEYIKARPNRFQKVTGILFAHSSYTKSLPKIDHVHDLSDHMEESRLWFWRARSYFPLIKIKGCFNFDSLRVKLSSLWPLLLFFTKSINIRYKLLDATEKVLLIHINTVMIKNMVLLPINSLIRLFRNVLNNLYIESEYVVTQIWDTHCSLLIISALLVLNIVWQNKPCYLTCRNN